MVDVPGYSAKFQIRLYRWKQRLEGEKRQRRGRGGNRWTQVRWTFSSGSIAGSGKVSLSGWPAPDAWKGQRGTIQVQVDTAKYVTYPIIIDAMGFDLDEKNEGTPNVVMSATVTGEPTYTGWTGTQPQATDPSKSNQEQYGGTTKVFDINGLQSSATRVIDVWANLTDTDAAELTYLSTWIGLALPPIDVPHNFKKRPVTFARDAIDGGTITESWGLTDTAEDVINPRTSLTVDPNKLQTVGSTAGINNTAPTLHTASGQTIVRRRTTQSEINDSNTLYVSEEGQRDTKDDVEMEETQARIDESGMESEGQDTTVFPFGNSPPSDAAAPDASLQAVAYLIQELNRDEKKKVTYFRVNNPKESWVYERTRALSDPSNIKNLTLLGAIFVTGSEPSAPGASGLVLKDKTLFKVTSPTTSNLSGVVWTYAETTSADDEIFPRTKYDTDPSDLRSEAVTGAIVTTGASLGSPSAPSVPPNLQLVHWVDAPLTNASASNQSIRLYFWGKDTTAQQWIQEHTKTGTDSLSINNEATRAAIDGVPSAPSGNFVLRITSSEPITHDHTGAVTLYGTRTPAQDLTIPGTLSYIDPNALKTEGKEMMLYGGATPPASPTVGAPAGTKIIGQRLMAHNNFVNTQQWDYGVLSTRDELVYPHQWDDIDASSIPTESKASRAGLNSEAMTAPTWTGAILVDTRTQQQTDTNTLTVKAYGMVTPQQEKEYSHSRAKATPFEYQYEVASRVSDSTSTELQYAQGQNSLAANRTLNTYDGAEAFRETPSTMMKILTFNGEDQKIHSASASDNLYPYWGAPAVGWPDSTPSAWGTTSAKVKVAAPGLVVGGPGGFTYGYVMQEEKRRNIQRFSVRRRFVTTSARKISDFNFYAQCGTVNSTVFMGYSSHAVKFEGALILYNGTNNDNHLVVADLQFSVDSMLWLNTSYLPEPGRHAVLSSGSLITNTGWYDPAIFSNGSGLLSGSVYQLDWPSASDFSSFGISALT